MFYGNKVYVKRVKIFIIEMFSTLSSCLMAWALDLLTKATAALLNSYHTTDVYHSVDLVYR